MNMQKRINEHNHKKKYGQNFLDDSNLLNEIAEWTNILNTDNVIEIGPGLGFLTKYILETGANLTTFEIDADLIPKLKNKFSNYENFELIHTDFLEYDLNKVLKKGVKYRVVANIPYYITSPIINRLIEFREDIIDLYLMVQKEVAERLSFNGSNNNRGVFSYILQFFGDVEYLFTVKKDYFDPVPKVDSAFIRIKFYKDGKYENHIDFEKFLKYVKASFVSKRKSMANNLKTIGIDKRITEAALLRIGKTEMTRAEDLTVEEYIDIIKLIDGV